MRSHSPFLPFALLAFMAPFSSADSKQSSRVLFDFSDANKRGQWRIVNDGVMGGRSTSRAEMLAEGPMQFSGNLSLANNGGFASVRSTSGSLGLMPGDVIVVRVRGDGRTYTFNLYVPQRRMAFSHQLDFKTEPNLWTEIKLPLDRFVAKSFGQPATDVLDPTQVNSVGILLGDKKAGPFNVVVDWIKVERGE